VSHVLHGSQADNEALFNKVILPGWKLAVIKFDGVAKYGDIETVSSSKYRPQIGQKRKSFPFYLCIVNKSAKDSISDDFQPICVLS